MCHSFTHYSLFLGKKNQQNTKHHPHPYSSASPPPPTSTWTSAPHALLILTRAFALLSRFVTSAQKAGAAAPSRCRTDSKLLSSVSIRRWVDDGQAVISHAALCHFWRDFLKVPVLLQSGGQHLAEGQGSEFSGDLWFSCILSGPGRALAPQKMCKVQC